MLSPGRGDVESNTTKSKGRASQTSKTAAAKKRAPSGSPLTKYFLVIVVLFSATSILVNNKYVRSVHLREESNAVAAVLKEFHVDRNQADLLHRLELRKKRLQKIVGRDDDDDNTVDDDKANQMDDTNDNDDDDDANENENETENEHENAAADDQLDDDDEILAVGEVGEAVNGVNGGGDIDDDDNNNNNANANAQDDDVTDTANDVEGGENNNNNVDDDDTADVNSDAAANLQQQQDDDAAGMDDANGNENENENGDATDDDDANKPLPQHRQHKIANLSCEAYGGPSNKDAEEMIYWEDIPQDARHMSPFHKDHPERSQQQGEKLPLTQFLTFEPDPGGWNNIRMGMETVLTIAFAMGRTLVLPPHQGMYLIDKQKGGQKSKFSFDHFFHMESISNEHIGLDIITTKEFLELCVMGNVLDASGTPIYPPGMRTDWDGAPRNELKELKLWMREQSGQNLLHWDPDHCVAAFPASSSEQDAKDLAALPAQIQAQPGGFPPYENYIGKPNPVDASPLERLKEMNAGRKHLCEYTPELQQTQWLHFPEGVKTEDGDTTRLLVHFYAFLFFQDWKQDLWMKRFVRDHVRYIDEIQCAAARVVTAIRKRVSDRTGGRSKEFDTIHIRRGDFQFKETRVDAAEILKQLQRILDDSTTLYIATDERDKTFFQPIVEHYPDVIFLDDVLSEVGSDVNTNYYGMIDQLVASRGKTFFGCWFSTFTGYINRLRGYHTDDHELPGYEKGAIPSYYYAMPDRFDHMREFWPIKQQFYAREFPTSWRLIDTSI